VRADREAKKGGGEEHRLVRAACSVSARRRAQPPGRSNRGGERTTEERDGGAGGCRQRDKPPMDSHQWIPSRLGCASAVRVGSPPSRRRGLPASTTRCTTVLMRGWTVRFRLPLAWVWGRSRAPLAGGRPRAATMRWDAGDGRARSNLSHTHGGVLTRGQAAGAEMMPFARLSVAGFQHGTHTVSERRCVGLRLMPDTMRTSSGPSGALNDPRQGFHFERARQTGGATHYLYGC
jgi:hypothetical protein